MSKGLPRSLSRGDKRGQEIIKERIRISGTVNVVAAGAGIGFGSIVIGDFPEGNILFLGAVTNINFRGTGTDPNIIAEWNGDFGIGGVPDTNGILVSTESNIMASTAIGPAVAQIAPIIRATNATQVMLDNTDGSLEMNLNVLIDAADITDASTVPITVTGELFICYTVLGDS